MDDTPRGKDFQALPVAEDYLHPHRSVGRWKHGSTSQSGQATVRFVTLLAVVSRARFRRTSGSVTTVTSHGQSRTQRCCPEKSPH